MNLNFQIYSQTTFKAKILVVEWSLPVLYINLKMTTVDRVKSTILVICTNWSLQYY